MKVYRIRGKAWKLIRPRYRNKAWTDQEGEAWRRRDGTGELRVLRSLQGQRELEVLLHEALHAALWDLDEEVVTETAEDLSRLLWGEGYRKE